MTPRVDRRAARLIVAGCLFASVVRIAEADGGPPMLTDDPGTPGDGRWEINIAWTAQRSTRERYDEAPLVDVNYGVGDRLQLKFEMPWVVETGRHTDGFGDALAGVKWRFFDQGGQGWQVSTYPQVEFLPSALHAARDAQAGVAYLLPVEVQRDFGAFDAGFEVGRTRSPSRDQDGWIAGIDAGYKMSDRIEWIGELHDEGVDGDGHAMVFNVGARATLSERITLLASLGTDIDNTSGPRDRVLSYLGLQLHL